MTSLRSLRPRCRVVADPGASAATARGARAGGGGRRASGSDDGFTLVEVLITIALMSVAFVAILGSLGTLIATGSTHRAVTTGEVAVRDLAEFVKADDSVPYTACDAGPLAAYAQKVNDDFTAPSGFTATVSSVDYWQGDALGTFNATCPAPDQGAQVIRVSVTGGRGGRTATQSVDVVKRAP